jgi:hypothetical protein
MPEEDALGQFLRRLANLVEELAPALDDAQCHRFRARLDALYLAGNDRRIDECVANGQIVVDSLHPEDWHGIAASAALEWWERTLTSPTFGYALSLASRSASLERQSLVSASEYRDSLYRRGKERTKDRIVEICRRRAEQAAMTGDVNINTTASPSMSPTGAATARAPEAQSAPEAEKSGADRIRDILALSDAELSDAHVRDALRFAHQHPDFSYRWVAQHSLPPDAPAGAKPLLGHYTVHRFDQGKTIDRENRLLLVDALRRILDEMLETL